MLHRHVNLDKHTHGSECVFQHSIRSNIFHTRLHACDTSVKLNVCLHKGIPSNDANLPYGNIVMRPVSGRVESSLEQRTFIEPNITKYFRCGRPRLARF